MCPISEQLVSKLSSITMVNVPVGVGLRTGTNTYTTASVQEAVNSAPQSLGVAVEAPASSLPPPASAPYLACLEASTEVPQRIKELAKEAAVILGLARELADLHVECDTKWLFDQLWDENSNRREHALARGLSDVDAA